MGKSKSRGLIKPAPQFSGNAKPTTKLKLITDFSEEFQQLSRPGGPLQTSKAATTKQNQLLLLCSALDRARVQGQHDQCQSLCANIRTFLTSNLEEKIVSGLAALLNSVCPLLTSTVSATRQAASVVIRILAMKVRPEVLARHVECLTAHVCSAVTACSAVSLHMLDLLQLLLVSAPRLLLCCSEQLLPPFLTLLTAQNKPQRTMMRRLRALLNNETSAVEAPSEEEKQKCLAWMAELKKPFGDTSPAPEGTLTATLQRNSSLLVVLASLVQLCVPPPHGKLRTGRRARTAGISTLWLQVATVVIGSDEIEALLRYCSLDDGAALQLMCSQLLLLEALHCATAARVAEEWLAAAFEVPLMRLHRLLLPPHASNKPYTPSDQLLRLQLSLLTLSCRCRLYRPSTLDLLTRALCDVLLQLENTPDVTQETATLYQMLFMNTFMWLQDDTFEHSGEFREEFDLSEMSSEKNIREDALTPAQSARADQLLADAMENLAARDSSAWNKRILSESQLLRKLPRHDVLRLIPSEHQVIIDPTVADVRARIEEEKACRARYLEDWNTRRQQLANQLFDALLQCKTITEPGAAGSLRVLDPVLALLFTRLPESCAMPRLLWWKSVLEEGSSTPAAAAPAELVRTAVNYCRFDFPLSCMAEEMEEEEEEMEDGDDMAETKKMRTT